MKSETKRHIEQLLRLDSKYARQKRKSEHALVDKFVSIVDYFENNYSLDTVLMSKAPNKRDLMQFKRLLNELPKDIPYSAKKRVRQYKKLIGIDRKTLLGGMVGLVAVSQTVKNTNEIDSESRKAFTDELDRLGVMYSVGVDRLKSKVQTVVDEPIGKATWSDRIWQHSDKATSLITLAMTNALVQEVQKKRLTQSIADVVHAYNSGIIANRVGESAKANGMAEQMFAKQNDMKMVLIAQAGACDLCSDIETLNPYTPNNAPTLPIHSHCRCEWSLQ